MKKLIVAAALVVASAVASASQVTWGAALPATIDATKITSGTFYLAYAAGEVDFSKFEGQTEFTADTLTAAGFTKTLDTFDYSSSKINNRKTDMTPAVTGLSGSVQAYAILIGDEIDGAQYLAYSTTPVSFSVAVSHGMNQTKTSGSFTYVAAESIPEPTSGLLLLLGMAGLALRRRRA